MMSEAFSRSAAQASTSYPVLHRQPASRKRKASQPASPAQLRRRNSDGCDGQRPAWVPAAATLAAEEAVQDTVQTERQHIQQLLDRCAGLA